MSLFTTSDAIQDSALDHPCLSGSEIRSTSTSEGRLDAAYLGGSGVNDRTTYVSTGSAE